MRLLRSPLLLTLGLLGACNPAEREPAVVLLISLDTLRADALGTLSQEDPSPTPHLDRFASQAVVFENAFCHIPHTLVSHMSMMTGLYPDAHGVTSEGKILSESVLTLAEAFRRSGYSTAGVVTSEWLKADYGFDSGFDTYLLLPHRSTYADRVNAEAVRILDAWSASQPLFLFLHYYDAHSDFDLGIGNELPYYSPEPVRERRGLDVHDGEFCLDERRCATRYLIGSDAERLPVPQERIRKIHRLYIAGVNYLDELLGLLFQELETRGLLERATIVLTSDHGEEFREHGRFIHSQPYDETIRVPLLVKLPGFARAGKRVPDVVETVDILPTLLAQAGIEAPEHLQGESLLGLVQDPPGRRRKQAVLSQDSINRTRYSLRTDGMKLLLEMKAMRKELYNLRSDPKEKIDIATRRPEVADDLETRLKRRIRASRALAETLAPREADPAKVLSSEERERLKALGYLN